MANGSVKRRRLAWWAWFLIVIGVLALVFVLLVVIEMVKNPSIQYGSPNVLNMVGASKIVNGYNLTIALNPYFEENKFASKEECPNLGENIAGIWYGKVIFTWLITNLRNNTRQESCQIIVTKVDANNDYNVIEEKKLDLFYLNITTAPHIVPTEFNLPACFNDISLSCSNGTKMRVYYAGKNK